MAMRLGLTQHLRAEQRLVQSPQMIQAMQVLQYPLLELKDRIDQELMENVFLEILEKDGADQADDGLQVDNRADRDPSLEPVYEKLDNSDESAQSFEALDLLEQRMADFQPRRTRFDGDEDSKQQALNNAPGPSETLSEHLLNQCVLLDLSNGKRDLVELVVYSLDRDGRLASSAEELAEEAGCGLEEIEEAIRTVQGLDPAGVGARSLEECLLLQVEQIEGAPPLIRRIVEDHLEDLSLNRMPRIAKATGASIEEVKDAVEFMRHHLHPHPGAPYGDVRNTAITPDVVVEEVDGRFEVRIEREGIPELRISQVYRRLLREAQTDRKVLDYLRKKIESAKWFLDAIVQRQSTIERIARAIVDTQAEFLRKGVRYLKPLRMQDIADEVGVHISTVSRAISGKYIQTPQGIFDMKRFFSAGTRSESGELVSQRAIKLKVKEIISDEDPHHPLSDDAIVHRLEQDGLKIARRTVTKYRKSLGIPSSSQRRAY
ncbi:MAG: RNA polymerase factor sigma-54 [Planctomycetota bacterium]